MAAKKVDTRKTVKSQPVAEKPARAKGGDDDFAAILHDSNTCQEVPWVPTRFAYYLHLQCEIAFP